MLFHQHHRHQWTLTDSQARSTHTSMESLGNRTLNLNIEHRIRSLGVRELRFTGPAMERHRMREATLARRHA